MNAGSPPSACHVLAVRRACHTGVRFFTLRDGDGSLLGCGALKRLDDRHGEIKSMRTADGALGRGVGGALLAHLVATARASGMTRLSLETGNSPVVRRRQSPLPARGVLFAAVRSAANAPAISPHSTRA